MLGLSALLSRAKQALARFYNGDTCPVIRGPFHHDVGVSPVGRRRQNLATLLSDETLLATVLSDEGLSVMVDGKDCQITPYGRLQVQKGEYVIVDDNCVGHRITFQPKPVPLPLSPLESTTTSTDTSQAIHTIFSSDNFGRLPPWLVLLLCFGIIVSTIFATYKIWPFVRRSTGTRTSDKLASLSPTRSVIPLSPRPPPPNASTPAVSVPITSTANNSTEEPRLVGNTSFTLSQADALFAELRRHPDLNEIIALGMYGKLTEGNSTLPAQGRRLGEELTEGVLEALRRRTAQSAATSERCVQTEITEPEKKTSSKSTQATSPAVQPQATPTERLDPRLEDQAALDAASIQNRNEGLVRSSSETDHSRKVNATSLGHDKTEVSSPTPVTKGPIDKPDEGQVEPPLSSVHLSPIDADASSSEPVADVIPLESRPLLGVETKLQELDADASSGTSDLQLSSPPLESAVTPPRTPHGETSRVDLSTAKFPGVAVSGRSSSEEPFERLDQAGTDSGQTESDRESPSNRSTELPRISFDSDLHSGGALQGTTPPTNTLFVSTTSDLITSFPATVSGAETFDPQVSGPSSATIPGAPYLPGSTGEQRLFGTESLGQPAAAPPTQPAGHDLMDIRPVIESYWSFGYPTYIGFPTNASTPEVVRLSSKKANKRSAPAYAELLKEDIISLILGRDYVQTAGASDWSLSITWNEVEKIRYSADGQGQANFNNNIRLNFALLKSLELCGSCFALEHVYRIGRAPLPPLSKLRLNEVVDLFRILRLLNAQLLLPCLTHLSIAKTRIDKQVLKAEALAFFGCRRYLALLLNSRFVSPAVLAWIEEVELEDGEKLTEAGTVPSEPESNFQWQPYKAASEFIQARLTEQPAPPA